MTDWNLITRELGWCAQINRCQMLYDSFVSFLMLDYFLSFFFLLSNMIKHTSFLWFSSFWCQFLPIFFLFSQHLCSSTLLSYICSVFVFPLYVNIVLNCHVLTFSFLRQIATPLNLWEESIPLGLTLRKTPSFLNLIEMKLSQGFACERTQNIDSELRSSPMKMVQESGSSQRVNPSYYNFTSQPISEKLKASNFPADLLKIGSWKVSFYC